MYKYRLEHIAFSSRTNIHILMYLAAARMSLIRHIAFLKAVLKYTLTAFGGPQGHIGMLQKIFVENRKDISQEELLDFNAFCQLLPGPSSTQLIALIGLKRGGILLATLTLLIWILPASVAMAALSFFVQYLDIRAIQTNTFRYIEPMAVGFLAYAAFSFMRKSVHHIATYAMMIGALIITIYIRSPWIFPALILAGGILSNFSNKRIPDKGGIKKPIKWVNLFWFLLVFAIAGILSELARVQQWEYRRLFNLFENFYRFGSLVFGGGHALIPMMYEQFISRPELLHQTPYLSPSQFLTGAGMINAIPGPVFSICSYIGGMTMSSYGWQIQLIGSLTATIGVFLPGALIMFFLFPIYQNVKKYTVIYRALEGIHAVVVGIMFASGFILFNTLPFDNTNIVVILITFSLLSFSKVAPPWIVLGWLLLGWAMQ